MTAYVLKVAITATMVVAIAEIGKRSSLIGAILASLPLTSLLAFVWLYIDAREKQPVADLSMSIFWMVIPSLLFFPLFSWGLKHFNFWLALFASIAGTSLFYSAYIFLLGRWGIKV